MAGWRRRKPVPNSDRCVGLKTAFPPSFHRNESNFVSVVCFKPVWTDIKSVQFVLSLASLALSRNCFLDELLMKSSLFEPLHPVIPPLPCFSPFPLSRSLCHSPDCVSCAVLPSEVYSTQRPQGENTLEGIIELELVSKQPPPLSSPPHLIFIQLALWAEIPPLQTSHPDDIHKVC